jgi:two-component system, OmpR family, alkaline phosphatase synthesis response regulator PhoP
MTPAQRILLVEDEESLSIGLEFNLREEGYAVTRAADGRQALERFESGEYDLVVLDLMLPYVDGFEVARRIRTRSPQMPILMLTARTSSADRIHGLEIGADDYLTKPFHRKELLLRIRGMLKRKAWYQTSIESAPVVRIGECEIRFAELTLRAGTRVFRLTPREAMVLKYIAQRAGRVVTRKELLENVWQVPSDTETRTVDAFIARLRKMLEPDPSKPSYIRSVRSAGYRLTDAREPSAAKAARNGKTGARPAGRRTPPPGKCRP